MSSYDNDTIVVDDKIYVPSDHIDMQKVNKLYIHNIFKDAVCVKCPVKPERPNFTCNQCSAYGGSVQTYSVVYKNGIEYVGFPMGERLNIERLFGISFEDFDIVDKRIKKRFDYDIKCNLKLRDYQEDSVTEWWSYKYGLIVAPPRSGKTVVMLAIAVKLGLRVIILANQYEFLQQFVDHIEEYTNLPKLEEEHGIKLYGFPKHTEDFNTLQIAVSTYQQFTYSEKGQERYKAMNNNFGAVFVDEAHKGAANEFARVLNNSRARIRMGVTGTDKRKDGRHTILYNIIGPVVNKVEIKQLQPSVIVHVCDYVKPRSLYKGPAGYVYATKFLAKHKQRNEEILKCVGHDLSRGHCIVIPVTLKEYVWELVKSINDRYGENMAEGFVGGGSKKNKEQREAILFRAKERDTRVIVGIRSILQLGLNVPAWSAIYNIVPISNEPNWKQESSRILTPDPDKKDPIIRLFVDPNMGLSLGCFISTYKQCLKFKYMPTDDSRQKAREMFERQGSSIKDIETVNQDAEFGIEPEDINVNPYYADRERERREKIINRKAGKGLFGGSR